MSNYDPAKAAEGFHPSEYVRDELVARKWSFQDFVAAAMASPQSGWYGIQKRCWDIVLGADIDEESAKALARAFNQDPQTWLNLQASYDAWCKGKKEAGREPN